MPIYREKTEFREVLAATIEEVWAYNDDRQAQVDLDPRIHRIDVIHGQWGEPGSRMVTTATLGSGETATWEMELVEVNRPAGYATSTQFPDGLTTGTHRFRAVEGGVEWRHVVETTTRRLNAVEYAALVVTRPKRRRAARHDHLEDLRACATALEAMRER